MLDAYGRFLRRLSLLALWLAGLGLIGMTVLVAWQVFGRYILNSTPTWTEPSGCARGTISASRWGWRLPRVRCAS